MAFLWCEMIRLEVLLYVMRVHVCITGPTCRSSFVSDLGGGQEQRASECSKQWMSTYTLGGRVVVFVERVGLCFANPILHSVCLHAAARNNYNK